MRYRIEISEKAREQLRALPKEVRRNVGQRMPTKHTKNSKGGEESFSCKIFRLFRGLKKKSSHRRERGETGDPWEKVKAELEKE